MTYTATVTQKGQVTIPLAIRQTLSIKPYEKVVFIEKDNEIIIRQARSILELKASIKSKKPIRFSDELADKSVLKLIKKNYGKK